MTPRKTAQTTSSQTSDSCRGTRQQVDGELTARAREGGSELERRAREVLPK